MEMLSPSTATPWACSAAIAREKLSRVMPSSEAITPFAKAIAGKPECNGRLAAPAPGSPRGRLSRAIDLQPAP